MSTHFSALLVFAILAYLSGSFFVHSAETFHDYRVFSVNVTNEDQLTILQNLEKSGDYDFWKPALGIGSAASVMVSPENDIEFANIVKTFQLDAAIVINDVQKLIDKEKPAVRASSFGWTDYYELDEIYAWLDEQIAAFPNLLTNHVVGTSYQNRTIRAVKLSYKTGNPIIFMESNIHAREWITSATATWLLNQLLTSQEPAVRELAENYDWIIVPVFNVDGFQYSHSVNRLWRKNRTPQGHLCNGVDLNRNFDNNWNTTGSSSSRCNEIFAGKSAASELETQALSRFVSIIAGQTKLYLSIHSYGQYFMFPYGFTTEKSPYYDAQMAVAEKFREAVAVRYGTEYTIGQSSLTLYLASGKTVDYAYMNHRIKHSYTVELRDKDNFGFILPANQIIPNGLEFLDGLIAITSEIKAQDLLSNGAS